MKLIVGNFKMNLLQGDINKYLEEVVKYHYQNVVYCPSNIYLKSFVDCNLVVGAQDVSFYENGAYTGDVSSSQLSSLGVKYVIIGHSERRRYYDDTKRIYNKLCLSLKEGLIPILCIGEQKEDYLNKKTLEVLEAQLEALNDIDVTKVIVAYEPIWAIGTGIIPTNEEIYKTIDYIKNYLNNKHHSIPKVLYGGSVSGKNIKDLETIENIDGYLVGGCSIRALDFLDLIKTVNQN